MANEEHLVFPGRFLDIFDRRPALPAVDRVWYREDKIAQASEANEAGSIEESKRTRVGNLVAKDGDRVEGASALVDIEEETVTLAGGKLYIRGDVRPVEAAVLTDVPMTGDVRIGVRAVIGTIDHEDNPLLLGLYDAGEVATAFGEPGAIRQTLTLTWAWEGDGGAGEFFTVYLMRNGTIIDQTPPPNLSGIAQMLAAQDFGAHHNYIVTGCVVTALGLSDGYQVFAIGAGEANIRGFKRTRFVDSHYSEYEQPDLGDVDLEPAIFADGGSGTYVIAVRHGPIASVNAAIVTKQVTETIVKGSSGGTDALTNNGVTAILSVVKGPTTYATPADYVQAGDAVSWAPGGIEPSPGESYQVTYRYLDEVTPDAVTATSITVSGGVTNQPAFVSYTFKLPRKDRLCFDKDGNVVYLKGISSAEQAQPPQVPLDLLALAEVHNDWFGKPTIKNNGTYSIPFDDLWRMYNKLVDLLDLMGIERLKADANAQDPAAKHAIFADPLVDDRFRDGGEAQTGAVFNGSLQIAIDPTFHLIGLPGAQFLSFTEEFAILQEFVTGCMKINPYQAFAPLPAKLTISPQMDYWTDSSEVWLSDQTYTFSSGNTSRAPETDTLVTSQTQAAMFLRQIPINFTIEGFGPGETLVLLEFAGVNVTPAGPLTANGSGVINGTFTIPAGIASGVKAVRAAGGSGALCTAVFSGEGVIETITKQNVITSYYQEPQVRRIPTPRPRVHQPPVGEPDPEVIEFPVEQTNEDPWRRAAGGDGGGGDPLAQSFSFTEGRHITGIDVRFCNIGNRNEPAICEIVTMDNGFPTTTIVSQTEIDMHPVVLNTWTRFDFAVPVYIPPGVQFAFVFKTNDPDHSLSIASRGTFDPVQQKWVAAQPYTIGVLFSSSNAVSWTAHQDSDLAMRVRVAKFNPTTRTIPLGTFSGTDVSDLMMRCAAFLPEAGARVLFEITCEGESPVMVQPDQTWERTSYFTGNVTIKAILIGTEHISPILQPSIMALFGKMRASGTYVSRAFEFGTNVRVDAMMKTKIPIGATITVEKDAANDAWSSLPLTVSEVMGDGWIDQTFHVNSYTAVQGRLRITLTGTPAARPSVSFLRAFTM